MSTIAQNLALLQQTKADIADAITAKGGTIGEDDTFADYASIIEDLPSGGGGQAEEDLREMVERSSNASITIPSGTTSIGENAFQGWAGLTGVTIPNSVDTIGMNAFQGCTGLTSVTIPDSVDTIGINAFNGCTGLTSVTISDSVTSVGLNAFANTAWFNNQPNATLVYAGKNAYLYKGTMPANTQIAILDGTHSICDGAFNGKNTLTGITIPNSVTSIGTTAFNNCTGLTSVTIGNSVTSIGHSAFSGCTGLTSVTIPSSVTSIGNSAFQNCSGLTSVTIPSSVTSIGTGAFQNCSRLTSADIGGGQILNNAFRNCTVLTSVTIGNSVTSIGQNAFSGCTGLMSVTIGNSVTSIGQYAFKEAPLTSVTIPSSVTTVSDSAFTKSGTQTLASVTVDSQSVMGANFPSGQNYTGCLTYKFGSGITSFTIGDSVTSIGNNAFSSYSGLTSVTIGNSVTSIGQNAFYGCTGLTSMTIPSSVTSVGNNSFYGCSGLTSMTIEATTPPTLGNSNSLGQTTYTFPIYVPAESVEDYKAAYTDYASRIQAIPAPAVFTPETIDSYMKEVNVMETSDMVPISRYVTIPFSGDFTVDVYSDAECETKVGEIVVNSNTVESSYGPFFITHDYAQYPETAGYTYPVEVYSSIDPDYNTGFDSALGVDWFLLEQSYEWNTMGTYYVVVTDTAQGMAESAAFVDRDGYWTCELTPTDAAHTNEPFLLLPAMTGSEQEYRFTGTSDSTITIDSSDTVSQTSGATIYVDPNSLYDSTTGQLKFYSTQALEEEYLEALLTNPTA